MSDQKQESTSKNSSALETILDLTITELFILQMLLTYDQPTQRYALLQNINSCIPGGKSITSGTLYRNLDNFDQRMLVEYQKDERGKIKTVKATKLARDVLKEVMIMTSFGSADFSKVIRQTFRFIESNSEFPKVDKLLFHNPSVPPRVQFIEILQDLGQDVYFLETNPNYKTAIEMGMKNQIKLTIFENNIIREPNDYFDLVVFLGFEILTFRNKFEQLLDEFQRVLKPEGRILIITFNSLPESHNFILNFLSESINQVFPDVLEEGFLKEKLKSYNLKVQTVENVSGILIGWGHF